MDLVKLQKANVEHWANPILRPQTPSDVIGLGQPKAVGTPKAVCLGSPCSNWTIPATGKVQSGVRGPSQGQPKVDGTPPNQTLTQVGLSKGDNST